MKRSILCLVGSLLVFTLIIIPAKSMAAAPYYQGKVITFLTGSLPGGGHDRIARVLAKILPKYIPGEPTIVVQNMPGAVTAIAASHLYNVAKPDGLTIAILDRALTLGQLLKAEGIRFDLTKFSWIGSPVTEFPVLVIGSHLPYKNMNELMKEKKPIYLASTGPGSINAPHSLMLKKFLGLNIELVEYRGTADIYLAIARKEVDGFIDSWNSVRMHVERGLVRPMLRTRFPRPGTKNLPVNEDFVADSMGKKLLEVHATLGAAGRFCVAPPGTPTNAMKVLRDAFAKTLKEDTELKESGKKLLLDFEYVPPERCLEVIKFILNQPKEVVKEFSKFITF